jgi:NAD(P)-dependent dehydrogenase (short-subunit alcohol dehydrogenase family)
MDPNGRTALITGGARMGREIGEALAQRGCHVAFTYRTSRRSADEAAAAVRARGTKGLAVEADLARHDAIEAVVGRVVLELGGLDILVCMASRYFRRDFTSLDGPAWREGLDADLESVYHLALAAAPHMRRRGAGRVIAFADWLPASGRPRYRGYLPYYVAKAGVLALTEGLALELAPEILVNAIAPGPIIPPAGLNDEGNREVLQATPLGRWGGAAEIAKAVRFLIDSDFVTGETIRVDGGRHLN